MKTTFTIVVMSLLVYLISGRNGTLAQLPVQFSAYPANPVLTHGDPGTFEEMCFLPFPVWDNGTVYLYYSGSSGSINLATSPDMYNFVKHPSNPVMVGSGTGYDSLAVTGAVVIKVGTEWWMYNNARQNPGWGPAENVGLAKAPGPEGPWTRSENKVLTVGSPGEWDAGFIAPNSVIQMDTGGFVMFYYAAAGLMNIWRVGMATSDDGLIWAKYNNPATTNAPYAESDPVLTEGAPGDWDAMGINMVSVKLRSGFLELYYSGTPDGGYTSAIGYASSTDGIVWDKWIENPIYVPESDPYAVSIGSMFFEQPAVIVLGDTAYMYYDYGVSENSIGLATGFFEIGIGLPEESGAEESIRITNYPNPVTNLTQFKYELMESVVVTIKVYDNFGRLVAEPVNARQTKGEQRVSYDASKLPSGIYYYRLQAGERAGTGKMIKL